eukprot:8777751-Pyramimonas_sp.AAC.1
MADQTGNHGQMAAAVDPPVHQLMIRSHRVGSLNWWNDREHLLPGPASTTDIFAWPISAYQALGGVKESRALTKTNASAPT